MFLIRSGYKETNFCPICATDRPLACVSGIETSETDGQIKAVGITVCLCVVCGEEFQRECHDQVIDQLT